MEILVHALDSYYRPLSLWKSWHELVTSFELLVNLFARLLEYIAIKFTEKIIRLC